MCVWFAVNVTANITATELVTLCFLVQILKDKTFKSLSLFTSLLTLFTSDRTICLKQIRTHIHKIYRWDCPKMSYLTTTTKIPTVLIHVWVFAPSLPQNRQPENNCSSLNLRVVGLLFIQRRSEDEQREAEPTPSWTGVMPTSVRAEDRFVDAILKKDSLDLLCRTEPWVVAAAAADRKT